MAKYLSIKNLTANAKRAEICEGMSVEYSDPAGDQDTGNYGIVACIYTELRYKFPTEEEVLTIKVDLVLFHGQKVTINASQILSYAEWEWDAA